MVKVLLRILPGSEEKYTGNLHLGRPLSQRMETNDALSVDMGLEAWHFLSWRAATWFA
jgi:hypothetical protein